MLSLSVRRIWLLVVLFALFTATGAGAAWQFRPAERPAGPVDLIAQGEDGGEICPPGERECRVEDEQEQPGPGGPGGGDGGSGGGGGCSWSRGPLLASLAAAQTTIQIPCFLSGYGWYGGDSCYYGDFPPIMEATGGIPEPPAGKTEQDGRYYYLSCFGNVAVFNGDYVFTWLAVLRWQWVDFADVPQATPEQVALRWLADATLDGVGFRLAPPPTGAGLLGLPVWLGVDRSAGAAWGPVHDSDCIGTVCVDIEALVVEVEWAMGDGTVVSCGRDQHVVWRRGDDFRSPGGNCHHFYQRASRGQPDGRYQIIATSHWEVRWSSTTTSGTLTTDRESSVALQMTEIQVLTGR